jgi:hypothetical protein
LPQASSAKSIWKPGTVAEAAPKRSRHGGGAEWIWNLADLHFAGAVQIVDLYHVTLASITRTPSSGCPSYSGQLQNVSLTQDSDGSINGSVVITDVPIYDSNCRVTEIENDGSVGEIDGQSSGLDANGDATFSGTMYDVYDDPNFSGFWKFTATLSKWNHHRHFR